MRTWFTFPGIAGRSALPPATAGRITRCCCGTTPLSDGWAAVPAIPGGAGPTVPFWFKVPKILPVRGSINSRTACPPPGALFTTLAGLAAVAFIGDDDVGSVDVSVTLQIKSLFIACLQERFHGPASVTGSPNLKVTLPLSC